MKRTFKWFSNCGHSSENKNLIQIEQKVPTPDHVHFEHLIAEKEHASNLTYIIISFSTDFGGVYLISTFKFLCHFVRFSHHPCLDLA
jgi:hypothetical protein